VGVTVAPGVTFGLSVDNNRTDIDVPGATGRIDLTQVGVIGNFARGPWNLGATVIHGFGSVHSSRFDTGGLSTASYHAQLWGAMAELSYYVALPNNSRFVPKLTFDWLRSRTDNFTETGGTLPVTGSEVTANRIRMLVGGEIGHSWLVGRQIFDFAVYARLVENLQQNIGDLVISDATVFSTPQLVSGVRESSAGADAGAAFSVKVSELARLYAAYDGRFRGNLTSHSGTVGAEFRW
jgi:outer membrane autotransporter protein